MYRVGSSLCCTKSKRTTPGSRRLLLEFSIGCGFECLNLIRLDVEVDVKDEHENASQVPAPGLLALDSLEQRLEIAFAEAPAALALDHFIE